MDDKYDFIRLIGKGETGGVYQAKCKKTGEHFTIRRFYSNDGIYRDGWELEFIKIVQQLSKVRHPNVSPILNASLDPDGAYVITEYRPRICNLIELCADDIEPTIFNTFVENALGALQALHDAEMVHGRLNLDSFLVCESKAGKAQFILKDYGLRRIAPIIQGLDPKAKLPSDPVFLTPEHFSTGHLDDQTDLYMFGQICYVLLAGFHPIAGKPVEKAAVMHTSHTYDSVHDYDPRISKGLSDWVDKITQPLAVNRFSSAEEALVEFKKVLHK